MTRPISTQVIPFLLLGWIGVLAYRIAVDPNVGLWGWLSLLALWGLTLALIVAGLTQAIAYTSTQVSIKRAGGQALSGQAITWVVVFAWFAALVYRAYFNDGDGADALLSFIAFWLLTLALLGLAVRAWTSRRS